MQQMSLGKNPNVSCKHYKNFSSPFNPVLFMSNHTRQKMNVTDSNLQVSDLVDSDQSPQTDLSTSTDVTVTLPSSTANPPVRAFIASSDTLNPSRVESTARMAIVVLVSVAGLVYVTS